MTTARRGDNGSTAQWSAVARNWMFGSPLRPTEPDVALVRKGLSHLRLATDRQPLSLIMGVTPEIYHLPWPDGWSVRAIDWTPAMIEHVWPGPREHATLDDWREMPFPSGSFDAVTCDGGINLLQYPDDQRRTFRHLARIVAPGGLFMPRLFVPPPARETPQEVLDDLFGGRIRDLNGLKMRMCMAMQDAAEEGVAPRDVRQRLLEVAGDWPALAGRLGWPLDHFATIEAYRHTTARYYYVTESVVTGMLCEEEPFFERVSAETPDYDLGDRCPTVVYRRTQHAYR